MCYSGLVVSVPFFVCGQHRYPMTVCVALRVDLTHLLSPPFTLLVYLHLSSDLTLSDNSVVYNLESNYAQDYNSLLIGIYF